jgi:hypothetical protein
MEIESVEQIKSSLEQKKPDQYDRVESDRVNEDQEERQTLKLPLSQRLDNAYQNLDEEGKLAWAQGWRPQEFFAGKNRDGSEREWKDAKTFLEQSKNNLPTANNRIKELTKRIEEAEKKAEAAEKRAIENEQKGYDRALAELSKKQRDAVESGDIEIYDELRSQELKILEERYKKSEPAKQNVVEDMIQQPSSQPIQPQMSEQEQAIVSNFYARNAWMKTDNKLAAYAIESEKQLLAERPYLSLQERLDIVEQEVKDVFHAKFDGKQSPTFAESSNQGFGSSRTEKKGYSQLNEESKKMCDNLAKMRGIHNKGEKALNDFRQKYAQAHFSIDN